MCRFSATPGNLILSRIHFTRWYWQSRRARACLCVCVDESKHSDQFNRSSTTACVSSCSSDGFILVHPHADFARMRYPHQPAAVVGISYLQRANTVVRMFFSSHLGALDPILANASSSEFRWSNWNLHESIAAALTSSVGAVARNKYRHIPESLCKDSRL